MTVKRTEQLVVDFPPLVATLEGDQWVGQAGLDQRLFSYGQVTPTGTTLRAFFIERTIDIGGFFLDEDTVLIPQMYLIQDPGYYSAIKANEDYSSGAGLMQLVEIVSTRTFDMQTLVDDIVLNLTYPGQ